MVMNIIKANNSGRGILVDMKEQGKGHELALFIMIFLGSLFYALSTSFSSTALRIGYSVFLYGSLVLMLKVYLSHHNRQLLNQDNRYYYYFVLLVVFVGWNMLKDFNNPNFSAVTLVNNPRALACLIPILGFAVGYNTTDLSKIEMAINVMIVAFCMYAGYVYVGKELAPKVFTPFILPFAVFNLTRGRYKFLSLLLFAIAAWHSIFIDYRTLLLRIILFAGFFISLNLVRTNGVLKTIAIILALVGVYIFLTDLSGFLQLFVSKTHLNEGITSDTRTFLYTELYEDLTTQQQVFGKGFLGTYFSQVFLGFQSIAGYAEMDSYNRFSIEVGVLQLILKGGYIFLVIYLAPLLYTTYKGLSVTDKSFKLEFNICIYLLTELVIFLFENTPAFHIHFFLMFFFAGYVYNQIRLRNKEKQSLQKPRVKRHFDTES